MEHFYQSWDLAQIDLLAIPSIQMPEMIDCNRLMASFWHKALKRNKDWMPIEKISIQNQLGQLIEHFQAHSFPPKPKKQGHLMFGLARIDQDQTLQHLYFWAERCIIAREQHGVYDYADSSWTMDKSKLQCISQSLGLHEQIIPSLLESYSASIHIMDLARNTLLKLWPWLSNNNIDESDWHWYVEEWHKQINVLFEYLFGLQISWKSYTRFAW